ncbi:C2H2-like zinc finger protein [Hirschfeldia incana]|nr:C2H2-like zinc finger protein [Hirschfeldia incana]
METITTEKEYICKFCNKKFPSGKSLGGHIRIHTNQYSLHSSSYNAKNPKKKNKKRLVDQREITALQQQQLCCRECGKGFDSLKDLWSHMDCCCHREVEKLVMDTETTSSSGSSRKRSKKQSSSESFSSSSEIEQEHKNSALSLMMMSMDPRGLTLVVNSLVAAELSSVYNSEILEAKVSSGEQLKMIFNVKNQDIETDNGATLSDSYSSDSDYFMNGPKRSDSDVSVDGCLRNSGDDLEAKEGRSKYDELRNSKNVALPSYESDSCADTNRKIHSESSLMVVKKAVSAKKESKAHVSTHECPICFRVFKSGPALGGHKRSHFLGNLEHKIKHKAAAPDNMQIDLNLPAHDI